MLSCRKGEWGQANVAYNSPQTLKKGKYGFSNKRYRRKIP